MILTLYCCIDVDNGEALGLLFALQWVKNSSLVNVNFKIDSQVVLSKFKSKEVDVSELGDIIQDCKCARSSVFFFFNSCVEFVMSSILKLEPPD